MLHRRVQFYELDSAGIVHFSTYFRYLEEAEHALWRAVGLSIAPPGRRSAIRVWPWRSITAAAALRGRVRGQNPHCGDGREVDRYVCVLTRGETTIATGTMTIVCVRVRPGEPMRAVPLPQDVRARFAVAGEARCLSAPPHRRQSNGVEPASDTVAELQGPLHPAERLDREALARVAGAHAARAAARRSMAGIRSTRGSSVRPASTSAALRFPDDLPRVPLTTKAELLADQEANRPGAQR